MSIHVQHCSFVDSSILSHLCSATIHVASFSASSRAIWSSISEWYGNNRMVDYSIRVCVFYCSLCLSLSLCVCGSAIWCTVTSFFSLMLGEYLYWLVPTACFLSSPCVLVRSSSYAFGQYLVIGSATSFFLLLLRYQYLLTGSSIDIPWFLHSSC